ncbi:hypothetical protein OY671_007610, partial [Metschnikowia pulcherrima]
LRGTDLSARNVRRAREIIHDSVEETISIAASAAQVGVSVRSSQSGFRHFLGVTPSEYVRRHRSEKSHSASMESDGAASVTESMLECGIVNFGRYAQYYRQQYGCSPSETSRKRGYNPERLERDSGLLRRSRLLAMTMVSLQESINAFLKQRRIARENTIAIRPCLARRPVGTQGSPAAVQRVIPASGRLGVVVAPDHAPICSDVRVDEGSVQKSVIAGVHQPCPRNDARPSGAWEKLAMMTMQALEVSTSTPDSTGLGIVARPVPEPGDGQVSVRIEAAASGFPDSSMTRGGYQAKPPLPFVPGMEAAGTVVAVGAGAEWDEGARGIVGGLTGGGAQFGVHATDAIVPMPDASSFPEAAALRAAYLTAWVASVRCGAAQPGQWVSIHGAAGGVGSAAVDSARALGSRVIAVASSEEKRRRIADL